MATSGGQQGNQNASRAKKWREAISRALARMPEAGTVDQGLDKLADKLVTAAQAGEQWALLEIGNRLDGKPPQAIIGGDEDDPPIAVKEIVIRGVRPAD